MKPPCKRRQIREKGRRVLEPVHSRKFAELRCAPGEVHVWRVELDCADTSIAALAASLSLADREKADRFKTVLLRQRWTVARGALRHILARYARTEPGFLRFAEGPNGKPELCPPVQDLSFNLSHTQGLAFVAVAGGEQIGIDAEIVRPGIDVENLSRRFFCRAEADEIMALPYGSRCRAFFACWTRKEAILKAQGSGLSAPLDRFQVSVRHDGPARLISADRNSRDRWTLVDIGDQSVAAALAIEGRAPILRRLEFDMQSLVSGIPA
jgi:4'-phosphopantetheinyl transferase